MVYDHCEMIIETALSALGLKADHVQPGKAEVTREGDQNLFTALIIPCFIWYMNEFQIKPEEEVMEQKFWDEFLDYKKKVRRWV
jgi:hypothetical protein